MASVSPPTPHLPLSSSSQMPPDEERRRRRRRPQQTHPTPNNLMLKLKPRHRTPDHHRMSLQQFSSSEEDDEQRPKLSRRKSGRNSMSMSRKSISPPGTSITNMTWGRGTLPPSTEMPVSRDPVDPTSYHLKWDDHLASTLSEIQLLLANELFVDVTLVCEPSEEPEMPNTKVHHHRVRAHKAILSNCSRYFEQMFSENPCKHPVIVLKDFQKWEVEALLDFIYRGQVIVRPDRIHTLLKAAEALQIRGLRECIESSAEWSNWKMKSISSRENSSTRNPHHPHLPNERVDVDGSGRSESPKLLNLSMSGGSSGSPELRSFSRRSASSSTTNTTRPQPQTAPTTTAHSAYNNHLHQHQPHPDSSPPLPRRKQARPRRRSGDFVAQDLRITVTPPPATRVKTELEPNDNNNEILDFTMGQAHKGHLDGLPSLNHFLPNHFIKNWPLRGMESPMLQRSSPLKADLDSDDGALSPVDPYRSPPGTPDSPNILRGPKQFRGDGPDNYPLFVEHHGLSFKASPPSPSFYMNMNNGHPLMGGPLSDSESNNPETPPAVFSPAGFPLLPISGGNCGSGNSVGPNQGGGQGQGQAWPGLPLGPAPIFGRHRAQHSAPRGGPPRAWSNADLTEALHNVWNKKMTTSQASRIFGIPYNSLLMYVRGKYGKSLKLDLLKKGLDQQAQEKDAAAAAAKKANNNNNNRNSPSNTPTPSSTPTPTHNQNPQNQQNSQKSKSISSGSPPLGNHIIGPGVQQQQERRRELPPQQQPPPENRLPPGFNPFSSVGSIFGDYSPPFPFPSAAAAVALSHILPHHHHHHHPHHHLMGEKVGPLNPRRQDIEK